VGGGGVGGGGVECEISSEAIESERRAPSAEQPRTRRNACQRRGSKQRCEKGTKGVPVVSLDPSANRLSGTQNRGALRAVVQVAAHEHVDVQPGVGVKAESAIRLAVEVELGAPCAHEVRVVGHAGAALPSDSAIKTMTKAKTEEARSMRRKEASARRKQKRRDKSRQNTTKHDKTEAQKRTTEGGQGAGRELTGSGEGEDRERTGSGKNGKKIRKRPCEF
jgi:hypothetical protein